MISKYNNSCQANYAKFRINFYIELEKYKNSFLYHTLDTHKVKDMLKVSRENYIKVLSEILMHSTF